MKMVRIKVKTLLLILFLFAVGIGGIHFYWGDVLYRVGTFYDCIGEDDTAGAYYKRVVKKYSTKKMAIAAANKQIENIIEDEDIDYFINRLFLSSSGSGRSGASISYNSLQMINEDYSKLKNLNKPSDE
jgi:hypothetical protein